MLPSRCSPHIINKYRVPGLFSAMFCSFEGFWLVISLFKMSPKHLAKVLASGGLSAGFLSRDRENQCVC